MYIGVVVLDRGLHVHFVSTILRLIYIVLSRDKITTKSCHNPASKRNRGTLFPDSRTCADLHDVQDLFPGLVEDIVLRHVRPKDIVPAIFGDVHLERCSKTES